MTEDRKRQPSWAVLVTLTLVVGGVAAFVFAGGPRWFTTSATPTPSASTSPSASPQVSPSATSSVSPSARPSTTVVRKWNITITVPATLLGIRRNKAYSAPAPSQLKRWFPFSDAAKKWASYGKVGSKDKTSFIAATTKRLGKPEKEADALMNRLMACTGTCAKVSIDPGPLGGAAVCAAYNGTSVLLCTWADEGSAGLIAFDSGATLDVARTRFVQARGQIERKVAS